MRVVTLDQLDRAGLAVRAWCFDCAKGHEVELGRWADYATRHPGMTVAELQARTRCRQCRSTSAVLIVPASRLPYPEIDQTSIAVTYFFAHRSKRRRR